MLEQSKSDFLPQAQVNEFLPPISRWLNVGGLIIVAVVGLAIPLASVTKYKVTVRAQANVRPAGELRLVQASTEGSIIQVLVEENQLVEKGDIIATIDDSRLQTQKSQLQNSIVQARLQIVQINAQISALNSQILAETDRTERAVASTKAELERRLREYQDRLITTVADVEEAEANLMQAQEELQEGQAQLKSAQANLRSVEAAFSAARTKRDRYKPIVELGALSQNQFEEAQLDVQRQEQAVEAQKATVEAQQQTIERLQQGVKAAVARLKHVQASLKPSYAEVEIARSRIAQEQASGQVTLATLNKEREALLQQRIEINKQLERDVRELQQVEIDLAKTTITATANGIISQLFLRNPGQTVRSGEEIAQIVPSNAALEVKAAVLPGDIGKVEKGQKAQMRVSACPYPDYGTLDGTVSQISEDTIKPQASDAANTLTTSSQKGNTVNAFYEVTIQPDTLTLDRGKQQCVIQLGMDGRADIVTKEETLLQFLLRKAKLLADF
ncbi:MAG: HlyD family efflux transporter periplasmic adaptor subunit [Pleurocapsa sp. MO_226.B13]|nr:HlyD family efflux transporter periplasmic adaptor subunit [Pleurocapsa sp. MO_226.B13]